jgi:excisionase family DNA binding protein
MEWQLSSGFSGLTKQAGLASRRTIYRMIRDGRLQAVKWGAGPWRIPREALLALLPPDGQEYREGQRGGLLFPKPKPRQDFRS